MVLARLRSSDAPIVYWHIELLKQWPDENCCGSPDDQKDIEVAIVLL